MRDVEAAVQDMRPREAIAWLIEAYRNVTGEDRDREGHLIAVCGMRPAAAKLYAVLEARAGRPVSWNFLETVFAQAGYEGIDLRARLRVEICQLRQVLVRLGWPVRIDLVPRLGYRLTVHTA